jgi:hypothetical protein
MYMLRKCEAKRSPDEHRGRKQCKEKGCTNHVARGKSLKSYAARKLGYCFYCYKGEYPVRERSKWAAYREGTAGPLSWSDRIELERAGFNPAVWSEDFRQEMYDYWDAVDRGELC